ncbi:type II toxin-antitoxin system VapC family toxin [Alcaligenes parafaecalis]|uniref:Type II toxin-antitoxin system VapC family toxin n=1 Tax=Alcaligenes parafaecalis TaxID=171260 RepID=A0ABT3VN63_9BURK|nr:type II toxin-antitoxin system VapC family toxin [Alcaligenes parafaecalis]MCX5464551.1 type II toxin-antitoxin system VapC family toxin [Alcaligenes parafaecalis]
MYLLDTNVISEIRKMKSGKADANVTAWIRSVNAATLYISVITVLELEQGILGKEREDAAQGAILRNWFENQVLPTFSDFTLNIDAAVAQRCAQLHVPNKKGERDALIAATALVHDMTIVTRNTKDFKDTPVALLNPWER